MPVAEVIEISAPKELESKALSVTDQATALLITDQETYERAASFLRDVVAAMRREIEETFTPICARAFEAHRTATSIRKQHLEPVEKAEALLKQRIGAYELEQRRIAEEAECRAREEAELAAAELIEASIEQAEASGASVEEIRAIVEAPVFMPRPVAITGFQKAAGITTRRTYQAEVTDIKALCRAIADGKVPATLVRPDMVALNQMARAQGAELGRYVPGVRAMEVATVSAGRR